ncbi:MULTISPECIES: glucose-6-phosphate isomerase [Prochlorococcus]|uniref:Glucose-6-phosphate isomerase n=1 Tax=Prochlorococcus marinus (strain SARG / CCMP1375 / SS120) TaxID=167539 RepID=G6PI_PROMA|nr:MULTISPECIES: glucose-6-phosphate isomerase [Prochlorococcus]Q7VBZ6.1 RecName: Full=Glucose-6-phosphate isomerase; Short=GPI; AltName: Full=Phosphoglucose isomerase; Short=PGI; AltName: Full=Phosphohexose isomerase; Short=PHI [Prochlorococcus marinus subsp. marinus str. CCMP1375]AAP99990.1 Glucose-6-phosphate isomerase [Prochlorococcus marinus subsp. marinus str. CCMP1375]KGG13788.1 Glucose-6-phosphate isomerase [Prochlorococcus marinus str. LG]KGG18923.1 Glucose-6-phosphate isomerase [Proch
MNFPDFNNNNKDDQWERFSQLLFYDEEIGFWLDISRMKFSSEDIGSLQDNFKEACKSMKALEKGSIANIDESRQVGHYWLRNASLAPSKQTSNSIRNEINDIKTFGENILNGKITTAQGKPFTDVLWIGIGGSGLGPLLIVNSLQDNNKGLNFSFLDNVDPNGINKTLNSFRDKLSTTLFVVVSKSGGTPEPQIAMDQTRFFLDKNGLDWSSRAVAITMEGSSLDQIAENEKWLKRFDLPDWVGGRTSITASVGLLPLVLIGEDIDSFLDGASQMDQITRRIDIYKNPSALLAASWYFSGAGKGKRDMVVLPYQDRLQVFSKYLQQLVMESLGKEEDRNANKVNQGLAVYGNKGSTDQHAYVQQLRDGIDNFFVTFVEILEDCTEIPKINKKSPGDYLSGFLQGTRLALSENDRQSITITIKKFNSYTLGSLIALFERAVGIYAELIDINAYHQPGVEAGKKAASNILKLQSEIELLLEDGKLYSIEGIMNTIPGSSQESIYIILRHLSNNDHTYKFVGNLSDPRELQIKKAV